jgi:DNA/RNA endonuclease YhcR with UshA esterase domain
MNSLGIGNRECGIGRRLTMALLVLGAAAALAACDDEIAPAFEPEGQGSIAGRLFFDADNNGLYTPVGGDVPFTGRTVTVRERGSTDVLATGQTDGEGAFSFAALPTGTHDLVVDPAQLVQGSDTLRLCQSPLPVSVYISEQAFVSLNAKLGCVIAISQVLRLADGDFVTVAGVVTAPPGTFRANNLYMQDATGGIQVFGLPGGLGIELGDSIEVSGEIDIFNTEFEIVNPRVAPNIKKGIALPPPVVLTTGELGALTPTSATMGRIVTVQAVTVGTFASGNAPIDDGTGASQIRLDANVAGTVPQTTFQAGSCYDITGVVGIFNNAAQLKPRGPGDIAQVSCS